MKVMNTGVKINIEADYTEIATIVQILDIHWLLNEDEVVQELAYKLHNPKVKIRQ